MPWVECSPHRTRRRLDDAAGLQRLLWGMYRQVFRTSGSSEQRAFDNELETAELPDTRGERPNRLLRALSLRRSSYSH